MRCYNKDSASDYDNARAGRRLERRFEIIKKFIEDTKKDNLSIGEIGAGPGRLAYLLAKKFENCSVQASDSNEGFIEYAKKEFRSDNLNYSVLDIEKSGLAKEVDFMITIDIIHHLKEFGKALTNIKNSIKPGGNWLIIEPNISNPYIFLFQLLAKNEGLFFKSRREKDFSKYFTILEKRYAFLIPAFLKNPSELLKNIERKMEENKYLSGSVVYFLKKQKYEI